VLGGTLIFGISQSINEKKNCERADPALPQLTYNILRFIDAFFEV